MLKYLHDENNLSVYLDTEKKSIVKKPKGMVKVDALKPPLKNKKS